MSETALTQPAGTSLWGTIYSQKFIHIQDEDCEVETHRVNEYSRQYLVIGLGDCAADTRHPYSLHLYAYGDLSKPNSLSMTKITLQNERPMSQDHKDKDADNIAILWPNGHPGDTSSRNERGLTIRTHVRMERLMLANPTAASPASWLKV